MNATTTIPTDSPDAEMFPMIEFTITRRNELIADGEMVGRFGSEQAAADTAIRFAQDAGSLYSIRYER